MTDRGETRASGLDVIFGRGVEAVAWPERAGGAVEVDVALPVLRGGGREVVGGAPGRVSNRDGIDLVTADEGGLVSGAAMVEIGGDDDAYEVAAFDLYRRLLGVAVAEGVTLFRIWNYLPAINGERGGLENYRGFNLGRWRAYREHLGGNPARLPAASAVGSAGRSLVVAFAAGPGPATFFENPGQVPAYEYPEDYGPRPPCFSRGVRTGDGTVYLSGTASIVGHGTVGEGQLGRQVEVTCTNVERMLEAMGVGGEVRYKVYLRDPDDLEAVSAALPAAMSGAMFLHADICRRELMLEIEAVGNVRGGVPRVGDGSPFRQEGGA